MYTEEYIIYIPTFPPLNIKKQPSAVNREPNKKPLYVWYFIFRIPTCTQHLILAFKSKKCRKYAFYAGRESIISILKIPNPYNTAQKSH